MAGRTFVFALPALWTLVALIGSSAQAQAPPETHGIDPTGVRRLPSLPDQPVYGDAASPWYRLAAFNDDAQQTAAPDLQALQSEVQELRRVIDELQSTVSRRVVAPTELRPPPPNPTDLLLEGTLRRGEFRGAFLIPDTDVSLRIFGFVKADAAYDTGFVGAEYSTSHRRLPWMERRRPGELGARCFQDGSRP